MGSSHFVTIISFSCSLSHHIWIAVLAFMSDTLIYFISPLTSVLLTGASSFNTELSFLGHSLAYKCLLPPLMCSSSDLLSCLFPPIVSSCFLPFSWTKLSSISDAPFFSSYFFLISVISLLNLPSHSSCVQRTPQQFQGSSLHKVFLASPSIPKLYSLRNVFLRLLCFVFYHWPHLCSATNGFYQ